MSKLGKRSRTPRLRSALAHCSPCGHLRPPRRHMPTWSESLQPARRHGNQASVNQRATSECTSWDNAQCARSSIDHRLSSRPASPSHRWRQELQVDKFRMTSGKSPRAMRASGTFCFLGLTCTCDLANANTDRQWATHQSMTPSEHPAHAYTRIGGHDAGHRDTAQDRAGMGRILRCCA